MPKKIKLLVAILTSSDIGRLRRCIDSVEGQIKNVPIEFDIKIVVNTLNPEYEKAVQDALADQYPIEITKSDGTPGTGKNAVFDFFRKQRKKYDYLFQIDGDDMLYPTAFYQLNEYFQDEWDVVSFQSMDWISTNYTKSMPHAPIIPDRLWLYSWCQEERNLREIPSFVYVTDPEFATKGGKIFTPGTSMVLSRKMLMNHADVRHTNEIKLFEDYLYFLKLFNLHVKGDIKMCHINNSYIYIYDRTNEDSISTHNCYYGKKELNLLLDFCKNNDIIDKHPLRDLEFVRIGKPDFLEDKDKIFWIRRLISKYPVKMHSSSADMKKQEAAARMNSLMNDLNRRANVLGLGK